MFEPEVIGCVIEDEQASCELDVSLLPDGRRSLLYVRWPGAVQIMLLSHIRLCPNTDVLRESSTELSLEQIDMFTLLIHSCNDHLYGEELLAHCLQDRSSNPSPLKPKQTLSCMQAPQYHPSGLRRR